MKRETILWAVLAVLAVVAWQWPRGAAVLKAAGPAPGFAAKAWLNTAETPSLEALAGKVVVLEFWATWCAPCRKAVGHLNELHRNFKDQGVVLLALTDESEAQVKPFLERYSVEYVVGTASLDSVRYGVDGIPHAVVIDRAGQVQWSGYPDEQLDSAIRQVLDL